MEEIFARYRHLLSRQIGTRGWVRCLIWGLVKAGMEVTVYFLGLRTLWMRLSLGLIWLGIAAPAVSLFIATNRTMGLLGFGPKLRFLFVLQMAGLFLLGLQLPLLGAGMFFKDGLVTLATTVLFAVSGYMVGSRLRSSLV